jgi:WD repeat-containing protein 19
MVVAFTSGIISAISTHMSEIGMQIREINDFLKGSEIHQKSLFTNGSVEALVVSEALNKVAAASHGCIKFVRISDWEELAAERIDLPSDCGRITKLSWTNDGQIMLVTTSMGQVFGFLTIIPSLYDSSGGYASLLSSLSEVSIIDCCNKNSIMTKFNLDIEPSSLKLGINHIAVGISNNIFYYKWASDSKTLTSKTRNHNELSVCVDSVLCCKREYFGTVKMTVLNSRWTAVLSEGKCTLHEIEGGGRSDDKRFPETESDKAIVFIAMTEQFLLLVDTQGKLRYYYIEFSNFISEFRPNNPIVKVINCFCIF